MVAVRGIPHSSISKTYFSLGLPLPFCALFSLSYTNTSASLASPSHSDLHTPTPISTSTPHPHYAITRYSLFSSLEEVLTRLRNIVNSRLETQLRVIRWAIERKNIYRFSRTLCSVPSRITQGPFSPNTVTAHDSPKKNIGLFFGAHQIWLVVCLRHPQGTTVSWFLRFTNLNTVRTSIQTVTWDRVV